ncbi:IPT/TIG domain-containing protein [Chloroflexi bacterium TSY]|nr:IPT/TIG domain-containing protein [Chloroflexi bacterium TSY]
MNGLYTFEEVFDADALSSLAGKTAFLVLYTLNNGAMPHMSAFVDDIVLIVDYPDVSLLGAPESGPPGTTFLLRSQYNVPYGWVDVCVQSCGNANNHLKTVYADAAGDVLFTLETTAQVPPGTYRIETRNAAGRTAATKLSVLGGQQATLQVAPSSGPAGTEFIVTGSGFVPNDNAIQATLNDQSAGTVSSDQNGAVRLPIGTNSNTPAGTISLRLTDSAGRSAATQFTITSVAAGDPQLTVNPQAGPAGTIFNFIGRNFVLDVPIAILINGQEITDAETRFPPKSDGSINITLEISEDAPPGVHTLTAVQGNVQVSSQFEITDGRGDETDPGAQPSGRGLYLTLVWTDPPVQASASKMLVNDLDLIVDGPDGRLYGNGGEQPDKLNNVETIRLEKPAAGTYVVTVRANSVNGAYGAQPYALVGTQKQEFAAGVNGANISPTIPITETVTPTATATATMTNTPTATQTVKPTQTPTATSTETVNPTPTATETKEGTDPVTPTATLTPSPTSTPTATVTPTATPSPTATETRMPMSVRRQMPERIRIRRFYLPLIANDATGIQSHLIRRRPRQR